MKTGSIVAVALLPLWLGVADAAKGSEQDASKILSPKAALKKALVAVGTPDEMKPELGENQKNGRASIPTLVLMQLEEFAYEMKDRYEALGANDTDGERSLLLRALQSGGEPDCSVTSTGAVKCCQASQGGNDLCIHFDCPVQGQLSDACTCRVQVNGYFCDSCSLCGDDGMDFDCNNVQYGMAANVCPNDSDSSYSDVYGNDSDEEYYSDVYGNDSEPDSDSYSSSGGGGGGGGDDEPECEAVAGGGVQCCSYTDDGIYACMTFHCSGGELTDDCGCSLSLNGNACRECDICPGGDGGFYADCSNIGGGSLPACSDAAGVGSGSSNPGSGGNGVGNNGGGSGSGNNGGGSGSGTGLGGFFGGGNNEGGNGGGTNGGGTANGGGTTNGGGTSGDGGGSTGNGGFSFPWSQQTASSAPSAGLAATSAIVIGGAVMAAF